jgi:hypothetical protein
MNLGILHLSDIHFRDTGNNPILEKEDKIHRAIQEHIFSLDSLFIVVSGDSAYSGKNKEFELAFNFLVGLKERINYVKKMEIMFIIIPGNHDCDFSKENSVRNVLIDSIYNKQIKNIDHNIINTLCEPQYEFNNFMELFESGKKLYSDKMLRCYSFELNGHTIIFQCINSSWMSVLHEKPGSLYQPIQLYSGILGQFKGDLVISVMHHPTNWLDPENRREVKTILEDSSDLILTGHEHESTVTMKTNFEGSFTQYIEGGVLQDSYDSENSSFNFLIVNLNESKQKLFRYKWKMDIYVPILETDWINFFRSNSNEKSPFVISEKHKEFLVDPGITIRHPRKSIVHLEDIYIFPDVKIEKIDKKQDSTDRFINLEQILNNQSDERTIIFGPENSGKTAFCKMAFSYYHRNGLVPVLINGEKINDGNFEEFIKLVNKNYCFQYSSDTLEYFRQLDNDRKVLIIDNIDKCKINEKALQKLMHNIVRIFKNIIITARDTVMFTYIFGESDEIDNVFDRFNKYQLMQFGHKKRAQFINNWITLGQSSHISDRELLEIHDRMSLDINTVIGNNYVPSYPLFLLIIIQNTESGMPHNIQHSSYGYYYELLITQSFINNRMRNQEIDAYYTYISELAFHFFDSNINEVSTEQFIRFNERFCREYDIRHDFSIISSRLVDSSILEHFDDKYRFKYPYIYYYFVAKYLSTNISEHKIRSIISNMCSRLHVEEFANIIMFLTHLSKDPSILNEVYIHAQQVFSEAAPTTLEHDIKQFNSLVQELPEIVYRNMEVKKLREKRLEVKDEIERKNMETASSQEVDNHSKPSVSDFTAKNNMAFKTIEIMGQIVRNYYGSIKADEKFLLTEETYFIGLRALNSFLSIISENIERLANLIQRIIEEMDPNQSDIKNLARKFIFNLSCMVSFAFIKKVAESVGSRDLFETYRKISEVHQTNAVKLIEISIKLDQSRSLPYYEIRTLKENFEDNLMAMVLLKILVIDHLYMYDTNYMEKQRICSLLGIPIEKQRTIDLISPTKKDN